MPAEYQGVACAVVSRRCDRRRSSASQQPCELSARLCVARHHSAIRTFALITQLRLRVWNPLGRRWRGVSNHPMCVDELIVAWLTCWKRITSQPLPPAVARCISKHLRKPMPEPPIDFPPIDTERCIPIHRSAPALCSHRIARSCSVPACAHWCRCESLVDLAQAMASHRRSLSRRVAQLEAANAVLDVRTLGHIGPRLGHIGRGLGPRLGHIVLRAQWPWVHSVAMASMNCRRS